MKEVEQVFKKSIKQQMGLKNAGVVEAPVQKRVKIADMRRVYATQNAKIYLLNPAS